MDLLVLTGPYLNQQTLNLLVLTWRLPSGQDQQTLDPNGPDWTRPMVVSRSGEDQYILVQKGP